MKYKAIIAALLLLLACSPHTLIQQNPRTITYITDSGIYFIYLNHPRAEVLGPILVESPYLNLKDTAVNYFPNGF